MSFLIGLIERLGLLGLIVGKILIIFINIQGIMRNMCQFIALRSLFNSE